MRQFFKQLHSLPALILGIPIALICFTGGILVFEKQITQWQNPALYHIENPAAQALPMATLLQNASAHMPKGKKISTVIIGDAHTPYMVGVQGVKKRWSINQYTGEMLGEQKRSAFFSTVIYLHRFFLDTPEKKGQMTAGKMFIGISTIAMVIILLSSLRLWWPKTINGLKNRLSMCTNKGWKRFLYDAHVAGGFYVIILLLLMCLTGLVWSFTWYREVLYALITSPERELMVKEIAQAAYTKTTVVGFEGLRIIDTQADLPWSVGKLMHVLHYGTWAGVFSQILYFIAMIVGTILPLSGYWFWYKKKRGKKKHDSARHAMSLAKWAKVGIVTFVEIFLRRCSLSRKVLSLKISYRPYKHRRNYEKNQCTFCFVLDALCDNQRPCPPSCENRRFQSCRRRCKV